MNEINVTPFVDVMLVLLIIFMITAPLLTTGIKLICQKVPPIKYLKKRNLLQLL